MKKYISPTSVIIEVRTAPIFEGSIYMGGKSETVSESDQLAGEHRGDWQNMWDGM